MTGEVGVDGFVEKSVPRETVVVDSLENGFFGSEFPNEAE